MERIEFRAPPRYRAMVKDIAKNRRVSVAVIYREALEHYLSGYSTIPSVKTLAQQVEKIQRTLDEHERALLKKGILE